MKFKIKKVKSEFGMVECHSYLFLKLHNISIED